MFIVAPIAGVLCLVLVLLYRSLYPFCIFFNHIYFNVFLMFCDCLCQVAFPRVAVGWSVMCNPTHLHLKEMTILQILRHQLLIWLPTRI